MRKIAISDCTLTASSNQFSFKEQVSIAKLLDSVHVNVIELPLLQNSKADSLLHKTIAMGTHFSTLSHAVSLDGDDLQAAYQCIEKAVEKRLSLAIPMSLAQIEYFYHKKPAQLLDLIARRVLEMAQLCHEVEFVMEDAIRGDFSLLCQTMRTVIKSGANHITLCDPEGITFPEEWDVFLNRIKEQVPEINTVKLGISVSNQCGLAIACSIHEAKNMVDEIKTTIFSAEKARLLHTAHILANRSLTWNISSDILTTQIDQAITAIKNINQNKQVLPYSSDILSASDAVDFSSSTSKYEVCAEVERMGYDLSPSDRDLVFEEFQRISSKKNVGYKELETIVATTALQVPTTYQLVHYVATSGNSITSSAHIKVKKGNDIQEAISLGNGPVEAAFSALEQIIGRKFELDDFQIQSVTEGQEAVGCTLIKLRSNGKLYAGQGISTDIVGASIRAYLNAINKILFEEGKN